MGRPFINMKGQRFGKLTVVAPCPVGQSTRSGKYWECKCDCSGTTFALRQNLVHGRHKSCGCDQKGSFAPIDKLAEASIMVASVGAIPSR